MKETAVEWLKEQYDSCPPYEQFLGESEWEQAKEMENNNYICSKCKCSLDGKDMQQMQNKENT